MEKKMEEDMKKKKMKHKMPDGEMMEDEEMKKKKGHRMTADGKMKKK